MAESIKKFIIKDAHGGTKEQGSFSVVGEVHVDIVPGHGEPYAESEYVDGVLTITIHNIEGNGITGITTDSQEGDEAVNTVTIKTNDNPEGETLEVRNGSRGNGIASSSEVLSPEDGGVNTHTITDTDGNEHVFHTKNGRKGDKGDQGDSAVYDPSSPDTPDFVMANETGQSTTKAMTQKAVTDAVEEAVTYNEEPVDFDSLPLIAKGYYINGTKWDNNTNNVNTSKLYPCEGGTVFKVVPQSGSDVGFNVEFLTSDAHKSGTDVTTFATDGPLDFSKETRILTAPEDTRFLYIRIRRNLSTPPEVQPESISIITTIHKKIDDIGDAVTEMDTNIAAIQKDVEDAPLYSKDEVDVANLPLMESGFYIQDWEPIAWYNNTNNANTCSLYPVEPGDVVKVVAQSASSKGCDVEFLASNAHSSGDTPVFAGDGWIGFATGTRYLIVPEDAKWLYIRRRRNQSSPADVSPESVTIQKLLKTEIQKMGSGNLEEEKSLVRQAHYAGTSATAVGFLHFSDLHGDNYAAKAIVKAIASHKQYIDDVVCTGDVVDYYRPATSSYPNGLAWWKGTGLPEVSLFSLGNHDNWDNVMTTEQYANEPWSSNGRETAYDDYYGDYVSGLGYVMPEGYDDPTSDSYKACFWHKDYAAAKVRLIGIDCIHRFDGICDPSTGAITTAGLKHTTNEQDLWLIDRLNECMPNSGASAAGYHVVVCGHYPLDDFSGENMEWNEDAHKFDCNKLSSGGRVANVKTAAGVNFAISGSYSGNLNFNLRNRISGTGTNGWNNFTKGAANNIANILEAWISRVRAISGYEDSMPLAAYLCGHAHVDMMFYPAIAPNVLNVAINQAGGIRPNYVADKSDVNYGRMVANYVTIDPASNYLRIVRIGMKDNRYLLPTTFFCYNYKTRQVISEG